MAYTANQAPRILMNEQRRSRVALTAALAASVLLCCLSMAGCSQGDSPTPTAYLTDGTAEIQVCKGAGIEKCDYEPTEVPELIDVRNPDWMALRSERKSSTWTMCYLDLPGGLFTKRKLMFDCEPVYEPLPDEDGPGSSALRDGLMKSLANMAEAAATFEVCAANSDVDTDSSLKWTGHSIAIASAADRMTTHHDYPELYNAFEMHRAKLATSEAFQSETLDHTNNCDADSLRDAGEYLRESTEIEEFYLTN